MNKTRKIYSEFYLPTLGNLLNLLQFQKKNLPDHSSLHDNPHQPRHTNQYGLAEDHSETMPQRGHFTFRISASIIPPPDQNCS